MSGADFCVVYGEDRDQQPVPPLSVPEFDALELLFRPLFMPVGLEPVPGGLAVWLVPAVPPFIDRFELVPLPMEAEPLAQPGRLVDAEPDELRLPELLVEAPGAPGAAGEVVEPLLWANAVATLSDNAIAVRGYKILLSTVMHAHSC